MCIIGTTLSVFGQQLALPIKRIEVVYVPWNLTSPIRLSNEDILQRKMDVTERKTLDQDSVISEFTVLKFLDEKRINKSTGLDVRMVIQIFFSPTEHLDIFLDAFKNYQFLGIQYYFDEHMINWLNKYVTPSSLGNN